MSIGCIITILYFAIGTSLAFMWWNDEYKAEYECAKEFGEGEDAMAVFFIAGLVFFWPFKVVRNYFESFVD